MKPDEIIEQAARAEAERRWLRLTPLKPNDEMEPMDWLNEGSASGFVLGVLWARDAGLLARPLPGRDEIKKFLQLEFGSFLAHDPANPARFWGQSADAVLALLKGQET